MDTLFDQQLMPSPLKRATLCFELERAIASLTEDVAVVRVSPDVYQAFLENIDREVLSKTTSAVVYFLQDMTEPRFSFIRHGSQTLIDTFLFENQSETIDKL
ncbi:hypothetical protein [Halolactibacillus sp. JCM 19043]|nr:hypothetical protein [Halolactibacillus sp. JCM 19043]